MALGASYSHAGTDWELNATATIAYFANYNKTLTALEVDKIYRDTYIN
jgi:hypothetical protein